MELLLLRFSDNENENQLCSAHKADIDIRMQKNGFGNFKIGGQTDEKYGEYNPKVKIRKEMLVTSMWWRKPTTTNIYVNEYQLYKVNSSPELEGENFKRRLLCQSNFYFFDEIEEDYISKCQLTIKDNMGYLFYKKTYNQIDNINRRFFTNR